MCLCLTYFCELIAVKVLSQEQKSQLEKLKRPSNSDPNSNSNSDRSDRGQLKLVVNGRRLK